MVKAGMSAVTRGDVATLLELADPAVEFNSFLARVSGGDGAYRGHEGLRRYVQDLAQAWEWFEPEFSEFRDLGHQVLMTGVIHAKGKSSGLEIAQHVTWLHTFRAGTGPGRYLRLQVFKTRAEALQAAGLSG